MAYYVAIPSNRVNVSYVSDKYPWGDGFAYLCRNPLKSGQCFLQLWKYLRYLNKKNVAIPSNRVNVSYMSASGKSMLGEMHVAIPSNRVNVSYKEIS